MIEELSERVSPSGDAARSCAQMEETANEWGENQKEARGGNYKGI